jgi:hypothetical protein
LAYRVLRVHVLHARGSARGEHTIAEWPGRRLIRWDEAEQQRDVTGHLYAVDGEVAPDVDAPDSTPVTAPAD